MTKQEVLERLCALSTRVGRHLDHEYSHDCFCGAGRKDFVNGFRFDEQILAFIEAAVNDRIGKAS